jgi:hypothetical protein
MKALIDRAGFVSIANGGLLRRKVGAAVVAVRRGGEIQAFDTMNHLFLITEMVVVGSCYWNMGVGLIPGDVRTDEEGMETMRVLECECRVAFGGREQLSLASALGHEQVVTGQPDAGAPACLMGGTLPGEAVVCKPHSTADAGCCLKRWPAPSCHSFALAIVCSG